MNMMKKIPWNLELKWMIYGFSKLSIKWNKTLQRQHIPMGHMPRWVAFLKLLWKVNEALRLGPENEIKWLAVRDWYSNEACMQRETQVCWKIIRVHHQQWTSSLSFKSKISKRPENRTEHITRNSTPHTLRIHHPFFLKHSNNHESKLNIFTHQISS